VRRYRLHGHLPHERGLSQCESTHGTPVVWTAAGSIEEGQDADFPGTRTIAQRERSGIAKEAQIIYLAVTPPYDVFTDDTPHIQARVKAIEQAFAAGADVINMSWGLRACGNTTPKTHNPSNMNGALRVALIGGALPVKSAGNGGHDAGCTMTYPAWRPEVLSVGGLDSATGETVINDLGLLNDGYASTSRGGTTLHQVGTSGDQAFSGIDLVAPACVEKPFSPYFDGGAEPWGYHSSAPCGTSIAAPVVSASAALLRDAFHALGWVNTAVDARQLLTNMILLGDQWDPDFSLVQRLSRV
jgi:subtilisin family serine protease